MTVLSTEVVASETVNVRGSREEYPTMSDFFTELGKQVAAELGRPSGRYPNNPSVRAELANIMGVRLNAHLTTPPPGANDSAFDNLRNRNMPRGPSYDQSTGMPVRGNPSHSAVDQDPGIGDPGAISGEDCLAFVQLCLQKLTGPDRADFLSGLTDLISTEPPDAAGDNSLEIVHRPNNGNDNGRPNGGNGQDRGTRRVSRTARDQVPMNNKGALDRRPAMDANVMALNQQAFARRFPDAMRIKFGGTGR
jgi:hypothetical protein